MQKLGDSHSVGLTRRALRFTNVRLRSRPETAGLAADIKQERAALLEAYEAYLDAREERVAGSAEVAYLDGRVDGEVMDVSRGLLVITRGRTDTPLYRALFPTAPSEAVRGTADDPQTRLVRGVIEELRSNADLKSLIHHADALEKLQGDLDAAKQRREDLYVPEGRAFARYQVALDHARRTYNLLHPRLQLMFPDDPLLVESFFKTQTASARDDDDEETPAVPTAAGTDTDTPA